MKKKKEYSTTDFEPRIVGFVCNWSAYSGVEMAGVNREEYPPNIRLARLMCLGRLHLGLILKAFELGADGVMLLGCPPEDCHYESGIVRVKEVFTQARKMLNLLGIEQRRLALVEVPLGRGDLLASRVSDFVKRIKKEGSSPMSLNNNVLTELTEEPVSCQKSVR
ncbi:hydrogenase iron-sulfur subunit [Chloroflexota bacterium]